MRPNLDRNQIPHAPGGNKQRGFLPKNFRRALLELVDRRVFSIDIVTDLRRGHRLPHFRGRPRHRVAAQIHDAFQGFPGQLRFVRIHPLIPFRHRVTHLVFPLSAKPVCPKRFSALRFSCLFYFPYTLLLYFISSTNTSFDTLNFRSVSLTTSPSRSTNPAAASGSNRSLIATPYSISIRRTSIPCNCRNPKNSSSSSACSALTSSNCSTRNRPRAIASTYTARSCAFAQRCFPENECAPAPNPRYGSRRQYFKLCFDSKPGLAQFEIS